MSTYKNQTAGATGCDVGVTSKNGKKIFAWTLIATFATRI